VDLRSSNLKDLDLSESTKDLLFADFDSKTQWPSSDKMPVDFDRQKIMEMNKDPGLGIRSLHDQGIDRTEVGIAIIDQTLLVDHICRTCKDIWELAAPGYLLFHKDFRSSYSFGSLDSSNATSQPNR
jgi:hypothetical protein